MPKKIRLAIIKSEEVNDVCIRNAVHDIVYLFDRLACSESVMENVSSDESCIGLRSALVHAVAGFGTAQGSFFSFQFGFSNDRH